MNWEDEERELKDALEQAKEGHRREQQEGNLMTGSMAYTIERLVERLMRKEIVVERLVKENDELRARAVAAETGN